MNIAVKRALQELSKGHLILLNDLIGQGKLLGLADHTTPDMINFMIKHGKGLVSVGIEESRAEQLGLKLQEQSHYSTEDTHAFTVSVDIEETTTGISATERYQTITALTDFSRKAEEFKRPGHIFPVIAHEEGIFGKQTHTELGMELAKQVGAYPAVVLCDLLNENGQLASKDDMTSLADEHDLFMLEAEDVIEEYIGKEKVVKKIDEKEITNVAGDFTLSAYSNKLDALTDYVFTIPSINKENTMVYIHKQCSKCHIMACDCHQEFQRALSYIKASGGLCLQMSYRENGIDMMDVLGEDVTTVLASKIMKELGVKDFQLSHHETVCSKEGEALQEQVI